MKNEYTLDENKVRALLKEKGLNQKQFAKLCGINESTFANYVNGRRTAPKANVNAICFTLGCTPEDIEKKDVTASSIITNAMNDEAMASLKREIEGLRLDLQNMAKMLLQINKTVNETKGQAELNAEELKAIFNKQTDCASNVAKIYGKVNHKF